MENGMRVKLLFVAAALMFSGVNAQAGSCVQSAHCYSHESGVQVIRGQHNAPVSQAALAHHKHKIKMEQRAREIAAANRLTNAVKAQNSEIAALRTQVSQLGKQRNTRSRRRVYYGNPRFFGRNGFAGNRNFSGATVQLPRRRHRPRVRPNRSK